MAATPHARTAVGKRRAWMVPTAVVAVAGLLLALVVSLSVGSSAGGADGADGLEAPAASAPAGADQPDLSEIERREDGDPFAIGPVDAPVVLVVFSDYQCPFCAQWDADTMPAMMQHVAAGDLRIELHDMDVFGPDSARAARGAYAAARQDSYLEYHEALFTGGEHRSGKELSKSALIDVAARLNLDVDRFAADLNSSATREATERTFDLGHSIGVFSTPAFLLGGEPLVGAQPTEVFEKSFATALEQAGKS